MLIRLFLLGALLAAAVPSVHADILFSIGSPGGTSTTIAPTADQTLPIFLRSDAGDSINGLALDFLFPELINIDTGDSLSGANTPGFFANDNLLFAQLTATNPVVNGVPQGTNLNVNFELDDAELIPSAFTPFLSLDVDASQLAAGEYSITYDPNSTGAFLVDLTGATFVDIGTPTLSFTVAAIPEPGSLACLACGSVVLISRRRRR